MIYINPSRYKNGDDEREVNLSLGLFPAINIENCGKVLIDNRILKLKNESSLMTSRINWYF